MAKKKKKLGKKKDQSWAVVTVNDAADMEYDQLHELALWLRRQATYIEQHADELAEVYRARYMKL